MLKATFEKRSARKIFYHEYNDFDRNVFLGELSIEVKNDNISNYDEIQQKLIIVPDKHSPMETKFVRTNKPAIMESKAIMRRSRLKRAASSSGNTEDIKVCKRLRNVVVNMNRPDKTNGFLC